MAGKMHVAVVEHFGKPLVQQEWDIPSPGPGQILVKTEACGVCHTDLHAATGDWPLKPKLPFIPGHEAIGRVAAVGTGIKSVKEGDRVGVPWLYSACGHCEHCLSAWETVCAEAEFGGYTRNGGFAEYVIADPNYVAHIPNGLDPKLAAPLICAGITTYKGIKETKARPGEWIVISGAGGLGHLGIQYAKAMGLQVCAVDIDDDKLALAKKMGADFVVNAKQGEPEEAVRKGTNGGAHGVLITAPSLGAFKQGVGMTRKRGTCVLVGLPPGEFPVPLFDVVANCITIRGSFVGTREDMAETLAFDASYVTGIVDRLEARGLVERLPNPDDRRMKLVRLTPEGETMRTALCERVSQPPPCITGLSETDKTALRDIFQRAVDAAHHASPHPDKN